MEVLVGAIGSMRDTVVTTGLAKVKKKTGRAKLTTCASGEKISGHQITQPEDIKLLL